LLNLMIHEHVIVKLFCSNQFHPQHQH